MRKMALLIGITLSLCLIGPPASAMGTGKAYVYDHGDNAMQVPDPYTVERVLDGGAYPWSSPVDVASRDGELYVLDAGGKVVVLDGDFSPVREIAFTKDGQPYETTELKSLWVDADGTLLVVDRSKKIVFRTDQQGRVIQEYGKPDTDLIDDTSDYLPCQVITDRLGMVYILAENQYRGIFKLTREGEFVTFFGSKSVTVDAGLLLDMFWRNFMTDTQIANSRRYLPTEYSGMAIDQDGFIYATSLSNADRAEWLVKLNSLGTNVLQSEGKFGDYNLGRLRGRWYTTNFVSVAVDEEGYITALDQTWNRLFQYSREGELLYVFGGTGEQSGTFDRPSAVRAFGSRLLVCDPSYGTVTVWTQSAFGSAVRRADRLYQNGQFAESVEPWKEVLRLCQNYEYAYNGLGKAAYIQKDYPQAMMYFKLGYSRDEYSLAYDRYRALWMRDAFTAAVAVLAAVILALAAVRLRGRRTAPAAGRPQRLPRVKYLSTVLLHPIDGFREMRYNGMGSMALANGIMAAFFLVSCLDYTSRGFIFNTNEPGSFNVFVLLATTVAVAAVFSLVNWLLSTFFEGKGSLREVWIGVCYALVPMTCGIALQLLLSQFLTAEEGTFLTYIAAIGAGWTLLLLVFGMQEIHQYSFGRNVVALFFTIVGILILLFLLFLMANLAIQVSDFVKTVFDELMYRIKAGF